ncbi:MAG: hypothetical protein QY328_00605 [Anaerolineales bacterium]|nr:MAG: hypothetical protein QY328_00605 [Anaerolineales bacterium]
MMDAFKIQQNTHPIPADPKPIALQWDMFQPALIHACPSNKKLDTTLFEISMRYTGMEIFISQPPALEDASETGSASRFTRSTS